MKKIVLLFIMVTLASCEQRDIKGVIIGKDVMAGTQYMQFVSSDDIAVPIVANCPAQWILLVKDSTYHKVRVERDIWDKARIGDSLFRLNGIVQTVSKE